MSGTALKSSGVVIVSARISNFRSLKNVEIDLGDITLLVGANNVGKTSVLDALQAAIGASRKILGREDIFLDDQEVDVPKDRKAVIDILLRPIGDDGKIIATFPTGSFWTNLWGQGISQEATDYHDLVIIRTTLEWSNLHADYRTSRKFLKEWKPFTEWLTAEEKGIVTAGQIEPISLHYIDAKRDLEDDLRSRASFWRRLTDDLRLSDEDIKAFETTLRKLNEGIIEKSEVLKHLRKNLLELQRVIVAENASVQITPVPRHLRDLSKGVDVTLSTTGSQAFPLTRHGMGTRSLASLLVFRAFASWRHEQANKGGDLVHTILALEEPEAHLHPQAQRALFSQISQIRGQRIVSTHSPYFAGQARLEDVRLLTKKGVDTQVTKLDASKLTADERRKLEREVVASRGDLLFARALILFEGETEELALPVFVKAKWAATVHELGFSFVGVGGGNYFPFVWLAQAFEIPWYIFSDGEPKAVAGLKAQLARCGIPDVTKAQNVVIIPKSNNYESQLIAEGYVDAIVKAIAKAFGKDELANYIKSLDGTPGKKANGVQTKRDYKGSEGHTRAALDFIKENKTRLAGAIAEEITMLADKKRSIPKCVNDLFKVLAANFRLS